MWATVSTGKHLSNKPKGHLTRTVSHAHSLNQRYRKYTNNLSASQKNITHLHVFIIWACDPSHMQAKLKHVQDKPPHRFGLNRVITVEMFRYLYQQQKCLQICKSQIVHLRIHESIYHFDFMILPHITFTQQNLQFSFPGNHIFFAASKQQSRCSATGDYYFWNGEEEVISDSVAFARTR